MITGSLQAVSGPVHTYPDLFENASFLIRFGFASTRRRSFRSPKTKLFENALQNGSFENAVFQLSCGRVKTKLFENADVTESIYRQSEHALGSLGITRGHVACLFSFIEVRVSNIVIEYRILLSNSEFRMSQRFRVDGDISENGPRVDADLFLNG